MRRHGFSHPGRGPRLLPAYGYRIAGMLVARNMVGFSRDNRASVMETEQSFQAPPGPLWRTEPFRVLFPLGAMLGWLGVGQWLLYAMGVTGSYSCLRHGLLQTQAFLMAFAAGFLLTALPRRTASRPASSLEMGIAIGCLLVTTAALVDDRWVLAQFGYLGLFVLLLAFALTRFLRSTSGRRPPAAFVLVPLAAAQGIAGASLLIAYFEGLLGPWAAHLGRLFVEQGVFVSLAIGIGSLIVPLMAGTAPPADLGSSPREAKRALYYFAAGALIIVSLVLEASGAERFGPLLRGLVAAAAIALGVRAAQPLGKPGLHRILVRIALWLVPLGLLLSAIVPDYRVPALHVTFIGGFGLMAFAVATHVILGHLDLTRASESWPAAVIALGLGMALAMAARLAADMSETYFAHLGWAAGVWIVGSLVWLGYIGPKLVGWGREKEPESSEER